MRIYSNKAARHNAMTLIVVYTRRFATNSFNFAVLILKLLFFWQTIAAGSLGFKMSKSPSDCLVSFACLGVSSE